MNKPTKKQQKEIDLNMDLFHALSIVYDIESSNILYKECLKRVEKIVSEVINK